MTASVSGFVKVWPEISVKSYSCISEKNEGRWSWYSVHRWHCGHCWITINYSEKNPVSIHWNIESFFKNKIYVDNFQCTKHVHLLVIFNLSGRNFGSQLWSLTLVFVRFETQIPVSIVWSIYRGSPDSTNFGSQENRVIRGIVLIGDWFSTKTREIDKFDLQSPLFYTNILKTLVILFRNQYLYTIGLKCLYFWPLNN